MEENKQLESYNYFLYKERKNRNLSKRKFSKLLKICCIRYSLIENGYLKPRKKEIKKISNFFGIDYSIYLEGIASYPIGIDENKKSKLTLKLYKMISTMTFKIVNIILILLSISSIFICFNLSNHNRENSRETLSEKYILVFDNIAEKGTPTISFVSNEIQRPEIFISDLESGKFISILGAYQKTDTLNVKYTYSQTYTDKKIIISANMKSNLSDKFTFNVNYIDYTTYKTYSCSYYYDVDDNELKLSSDLLKDELEEKEYNEAISDIESLLSNIDEEFTNLIDEKLGIEINFYNDLVKDVMNSKSVILKKIIFFFVGGLSSICLTLALCFLLIYSFLYGNKENDITIFRNSTTYSDLTINQLGRKDTIKKDIRFFPIIPESILKLLGIFMVFAGSIKILLVFLKFLGLFPDSPIIQAVNYELDIWFNIGLFLIFFINFDIFKDDRRSIRNIFVYFFVFIGVYILELIIINTISKFAIGKLFVEETNATLPNYFGTICCYFLIMLFLFNNPRWANTKKKLLAFRLLSLIPILIIVVSTILNYVSKINYWNIPLWFKYLINTGRPQISALCILYLIGLYFLRLFFKMRYGTESCKTLFNGNKYMFYKNILMSALIVIISLFELILSNNTLAHKFDLGLYPQFILLAPLMLLYHPHLGGRNKVSDYFVLGMYIFLYGFGYIIIGGILFLMLI